jgi:hypothetical protein
MSGVHYSSTSMRFDFSFRSRFFCVSKKNLARRI